MNVCPSQDDQPARGRASYGTSFSIWTPLNAFGNAGTIYSLALVLVVLLAAALRFHDLDRTSLWTDELASWEQARLPFLDMLAATAQDNYPPLHNIILHVTMALFGDGETALRAPSALLGVANVYLLYRLASVLWDRNTGLIAALLLALSGFHVWYSTEARMYTLLAFTATLFVLTVVYATRRPNWQTLTGCAGAGTALLYSHIYGSFVFVGVNIVVLIALALRKHWLVVDWKAWAAAQAVPVLLFLHWALILWHRSAIIMQRGNWIPEPTAGFLLTQALSLTGGPLSLGILTTLAAISVTNLRAVLPGGQSEPLVEHRWANLWLRLDWRNAILIAWIVVPIGSAYLMSIIRQPILVDRYAICVLPAFLLLAARGLMSFSVSILATAFILGLIVMALIPDLTYSTFVRVRQDNRQAVRSFSTSYRPSDRIFFIYRGGLSAFQYYFRRAADVRVCMNSSGIASADLDVDRFWLILGQHAYATKGLGKYALSMAERTHSNTDSLGLSPILTMYLFQRRADDLAVLGDASPSTESRFEADKASPEGTAIAAPYDCSGRQIFHLYKPWRGGGAKILGVPG
jgi:mannosyltransferase